MGLTWQAPAHAAARDLERALGDPSHPDAPVSFGALVQHDEREEPPSGAFEALRAWGVHAHLVPLACGGRLTSFDELLALVRVVSRRDLVLTTGLGSTMLAAIPVWAWGGDDQRREVAGLLLGTGAFGSFAVSERDAGSDFLATATRAETADGGYMLRGEKWLIGNASRCSFVVALARTRPSLSLLFLRPDQVLAGAVRRALDGPRAAARRAGAHVGGGGLRLDQDRAGAARRHAALRRRAAHAMSDLSTVAGLLENAATGSGLVSVLAGGCEEVRVAELWRRSERAAAWFLETVGRDGAVGLLMETSLDCLVSLLGAWRAGVTTASCTGEASWLSRPSCGSEGGRDA